MKAKFVIFAALFVVFFASCSEKDDKGQLDPNAMISLRAEKESRAEDTRSGHLTAREIVEQADGIKFTNKKWVPDAEHLSRGFAPAQRDIANERLLMWGTDIITQRGEWAPDFIGGEDHVIERFVRTEESGYVVIDTIAYVKNHVLRSAYDRIKKAYDDGDYKTCYKLFDEVFVFTPITGAEWRELKRQGLN